MYNISGKPYARFTTEPQPEGVHQADLTQWLAFGNSSWPGRRLPPRPIGRLCRPFAPLLPWKPPYHLELRLRASAPNLPGTWGFGLWNDPFILSLGLGGGSRRFPALPNAAWFFFASPHNYLSFRNDLPARGFLAATFASPHLPAPLLALASLAAPGFLVPFLSQLLRLAARQFVSQDAALITTDPTDWHTYSLDWQVDRILLSVDSNPVLDTPITPKPPLGLVIWIDNQYAALPPSGGLHYGFLANIDPSWIEILLDNPIANR